jgi:hypothetical protein
MKCPRFWIVTPCSLVRSIDIPEEGIASIFRIEEKTKARYQKIHPEDGGDMFLWNGRGLLPSYMAL